MPDLEWQKSSYSSGDPSSDCLEVARGPATDLHFRESDDPGIVLTTSRGRWSALLRLARQS
ncbi:hypothetical protein SUDANB171_03285 [Streptomyces sp. enrichment culture]|uniref:DUF397 domain-containing protein n=1 Tax=Streptomyces sp. enrichment culture TaxID=1795815 RepID=UPI003F54654D